MTTPPNQPPNPRIRVANPGEEKPKSKYWETIKIAAITTLAGAAAMGIGVSVYKYAVKRTRRLLRREEQREENSTPTMHPSFQHAVGYPSYPGYPAYAPVHGPHPYAQPWPSVASERDRMPEALREIPNFQPVAAPGVAPTFVAPPPPPPSADPNMRRFMDDMRKRLDNIESYLQGDDEDDEDDDRGKN